jgi:hypothetical protein
MRTAKAIHSRSGVIGFVPADAFAGNRDEITIEVNLTVLDGAAGEQLFMTRILTTRDEMELYLYVTGGVPGAATLRNWVIAKATAVAKLTRPSLKQDDIISHEIYWVCHTPDRREPFLR